MSELRRTILWIDDERFALTNYKILLERKGFRVFCAYSFSEGKHLMEQYASEAELVILDVMMPIGDASAVGQTDTELAKGGYEAGAVLARWARERFPSLPIIAYSSCHGDDIPAWLESQGIRYVPKTMHFTSTDDFLDMIYNASTKSLASVARCKTFIVHGHDEVAKLELKNYIQNVLRMPEPCVLQERPSRGRTLIEKFEDEAAEANLVFVLLTPDDRVVPSSREASVEVRPRPNVVFELGFFMAKLGRRKGKIIILYKEGAHVPSDLAGVVYIDITFGIEHAGEAIRRELEGFCI
jgi:CheY-like chemotaxis protein